MQESTEIGWTREESDKFIADFQQFLQEALNLNAGKKILLAVSTGVDSMVMAELFQVCEIQIAIAHCNFSLRSQSKQEEEFIRTYCEERQIPLFVRKFAPLKKAEEEGISMQMAAREQRYTWWQQIREKEKFDFIATAHHLDDQIETILLNLFRSTGIKGLQGIPLKTNHIIRPLMFANRAQIKAFAQFEGLQWYEDSSNASSGYQRNYLRHQILPRIIEKFPQAGKSILKLLPKAALYEKVFQNHLEILKNQYLVKENDANIFQFDQKFTSEDKNATLLFYLLNNYGFNEAVAGDIFNSIKGDQTGNIFYSKTHEAVIDRGKLVLYRLQFSDETVLVNNQDQYIHWNNFNIRLEKTTVPTQFTIEKSIVYIGEENIAWPLKITTWKEGDFFYPLGLNKKKKLKKFFVDEKIDRGQKHRIPILRNQDEIVWVMGHRLDERYKVKKNDLTCLKISIRRK